MIIREFMHARSPSVRSEAWTSIFRVGSILRDIKQNNCAIKHLREVRQRDDTHIQSRPSVIEKIARTHARIYV